MRNDDQTDFMAGEIESLLAFASALIKTHPNVDALDLAFSDSKKRQAASTHPATLSDPFLLGQEQISARLRVLLVSSRHAQRAKVPAPMTSSAAPAARAAVVASRSSSLTSPRIVPR